MPIFTVPVDDSDLLLEHGTPGDPDYPHKGGRGTAKPAATGTAGTSYARPKVIQVTDIDEAIRLISEGKAVELPDTRSVNTLLDRLAKVTQAMAAAKQDIPDYDLCKVSVKGTNLFCRDVPPTDEHPAGTPRLEMPQFSGKAVPGSPASKLTPDHNGNVDGAAEFLKHLESLGYKVTSVTEKAGRLRASQTELVGEQVAGMMNGAKNGTYDPRLGRIFVSRDHYVLDGHHRWAAVVGLDAADNDIGQITMDTAQVDAPISELLPLARAWTKSFGIKAKAGKKKAAK